MCRNVQQELRSLNADLAGMNLSQAEAQRAIHQGLYDRCYRSGDFRPWDEHILEHRRQARQRRIERSK